MEAAREQDVSGALAVDSDVQPPLPFVLPRLATHDDLADTSPR